MSFNYSYWEKETFVRDCDCIVIGGGLVGINTAISLKEQNCDVDVLVIERAGFPLGASTRNAGFACFGSVSELLDDFSSASVENVMKLLVRRLDGLSFLRQRVGDKGLDYRGVGGYEVFDNKQNVGEEFLDEVQYLNKNIKTYTGLENTFSLCERDFGFSGFNRLSIFNQYEGALHPGKMMESLYNQAHQKGVRFLMGTTVDEVLPGGYVKIGNNSIRAAKIAVCTNGFSTDLFPDIDLKPARNQVLVTERIPGLKLDSCFHFDKGYVYFRNVEDRILIGGGRNKAPYEESSSDFNITNRIRSYLISILREKIGVSKKVQIEYEWSGIMGVGAVKTPILEKKDDSIIFALRLGGMGVALGSKLGDDAAKLMLRDTTE